MAEDWVALGLDYDAFWGLSLREHHVVARGVRRRIDDQMHARRILQQELAHLFAFAQHEPRKMPDLTKVKAAAGPMPSPPADDPGAHLRQALMGMAARANARASRKDT